MKNYKKHFNWKGDKVGYFGLHTWLYKYYGKAYHCKKCGKNKGKFEWANKEGIYKRDVKYWWQLCISCHRKIDNLNPKIENKLRSNNVSGFRGVSWDKKTNKWRAVLMINKKQKWGGRFDSKKKAIEKYKLLRLKYA